MVAGPGRWPVLLAVCVLACLVSAVFAPMVGFEFLESDVVDHVVYNPHIRGLTAENVWHILTSRCITSYYPVRTLTFAIDYQIWGLSAGGFKLTNGLIHLANVFLVFWLILRLLRLGASTEESAKPWWTLSAAAFAAGIFAVHPVVVEPVVWVSGREELLMTLGALGCIHCHLWARRLSQQRAKTRWLLASRSGTVLCCAVACLSNAVAAIIPFLIAAWDLLTLAGPKLRRIVRGGAPLWAIAMLTVLLKGPGHDVVLAREVGTFTSQRLMLILNVYWLNLKTLAWPTDLALSYQHLAPQGFSRPEALLGGVALGLTCLVLWKLRRRKLMLFGLLWFGLALGPVSQIMPHHIHRADRFLYLPLVGLVLALGVGLRLLPDGVKPLGSVARRLKNVPKTLGSAARRLKNASKPRPAWAGMIRVGSCLSGVLCLALLAMLSIYQVQTWQNSVSAWVQCVRAAPENPIAHRALADSLAKRGRFDLAIPSYQKALELEPDYIDALRNFAFYLVSGQDEELPDHDPAVQLAERACQLTAWMDPDLLRTLAMAYARQQRLEDAVATAQKSLRLSQAAGNRVLTEEIQRQLKLYENRASDRHPR